MFYCAARTVANGTGVEPVMDSWIVSRSKDFAAAPQLRANFEQVLVCLFRWAAVLRNTTDVLALEGTPKIKADYAQVRAALDESKRVLVKVCKLPSKNDDADASRTHKDFLKKILTRPLNLKRANVFTLNYDTLIEQAAEADGIVLIDSFICTVRRTFRPESFDQDLYFPAETTEGRVHRLDRFADQQGASVHAEGPGGRRQRHRLDSGFEDRERGGGSPAHSDRRRCIPKPTRSCRTK